MRYPHFDLKISAGGKPYWMLVGINGEILCVSEEYESTQAARKGIKAARLAAPLAKVREFPARAVSSIFDHSKDIGRETE